MQEYPKSANTGNLKQRRKIGVMRRLPERKGWAKAFQEMAKNGDDKLVMPDVFNDEIIHDELPGIRR